jgi:hypothetical protein
MFFLENYTMQTLINTYIHSPLWRHARTPYLYEHLRETEPAYLEVDEVTTDGVAEWEDGPCRAVLQWLFSHFLFTYCFTASWAWVAGGTYSITEETLAAATKLTGHKHQWAVQMAFQSLTNGWERSSWVVSHQAGS